VNWSRRYAITSYLLSTVWIAPVLALVLEQLTFRIAYAYQIDFGWVPGFVVGREGTMAMADYAVSSSIAFIVFTFSSLIVAIQVASGQLTPRIIATALLRDNAIRGSVAIFIYELLLAVAVKTRVDTIPHSLVSMIGVLGILSVLVFMFLIDHAARLLRPVSIIWRISEKGRQVIDDVYPNKLPAPSTTPLRAPDKLGPPERTIVRRDRSAIVIAVNLDALVAEAKRVDAVIELVPRVGDFVAKDDVLFHLRGAGATKLNERFLHGQVAFGRERTIEQDSTFAFRVIVDIAIKALSPAINDPTTAVIAIDQLHHLLRAVGSRDLRDERVLDSEGQLRLIFHTPNWKDFNDLTFSEIRLYGAGNFQVVRRLRAMIESLSQNLPERRVPALREELDLLDRAAQKLYPFPEDLALTLVADSQGLGGASSV